MRPSWELELDHQAFMERVRAMVRPQAGNDSVRIGVDAALTVKLRKKIKRVGGRRGHYGPHEKRDE